MPPEDETPAEQSVSPPYITKRNRIPVQRVSKYGDPFDDGIAFALAYETRGDLETGAPHHHPKDPGGFTKFGVAQNYNRDVDVPNLTLDDAVKLYRSKYWPEAAKVPEGAKDLRALYFEGYMNQGGNATKALQRAVETDDDGAFGKNTKHALDKALAERGEAWVIREYLFQRQRHYQHLANADPDQYGEFLKGWENRIYDAYAYYDDVLKSRAV